MFLNMALLPPTGENTLLQLISSDNWIKMAALSFCTVTLASFSISVRLLKTTKKQLRMCFAAVSLLIGAVVVGLAVELRRRATGGRRRRAALFLLQLHRVLFDGASPADAPPEP